MRRTELALMPTSSDVAPAVQWVVSLGGSARVSDTNGFAISAGRGGMRDGRVLSRSGPITPACMKRSCQRSAAVLALPMRRIMRPVRGSLRAQHSARERRLSTTCCGFPDPRTGLIISFVATPSAVSRTISARHSHLRQADLPSVWEGAGSFQGQNLRNRSRMRLSQLSIASRIRRARVARL